MSIWYRRCMLAAALLALAVVALGAYVRLTDAGLGCPDWPGCYGQVTWPTAPDEIAAANASYDRPVEIDKAWREMAHRYLASGLGLLILIAGYLAWRHRATASQDLWLPMSLVALVIAQGALGAFTVTMQLKPIIVTAHLLGGITTLTLCWLAYWRTRTVGRKVFRLTAPGVRSMIWAALAVVGVQIFLGGWVSTNYAALACPDVPTCQGEIWPETDFADGFVLWRGVGVDYEGGVLDTAARTAIHMAHRIGAIVVTAVLIVLALLLFRSGLVGGGAAVLALLAVQLALGVTNVVGGLPLWVATAHNVFAALIVLKLVALLTFTRSQ